MGKVTHLIRDVADCGLVVEHDCDHVAQMYIVLLGPLRSWFSSSRSLPSHSCRSSSASACENQGGGAYRRWAWLFKDDVKEQFELASLVIFAPRIETT